MKIEKTGASIDVVSTEEIPPDPANLITALRQIGYTLEQSIADLIDNSINAEARKVLVRFVHDGKNIQRLVIADDGDGMNAKKLREAMKFGSEQPDDGKSLGKYGLGLKVASFGYAKTLTVMTRQRDFVGGRRWTVDGISDGWMCANLNTEQVRENLNQPLGNVDISKKGTILVWSDIDRLTVDKDGIAKTLQKITKKLNLHFGLCFHRFIENEKLEIRIDDRAIGSEESDICTTVKPVNPFKYGNSGAEDFPKTYKANVPGVGPLSLTAHIWPPNSKAVEYKLGSKAAARQGFYFYRNDRLIQPGGWNGVVENETEPHTSLARIVVNMSRGQDAQYGLNVQKSAIIVPTTFTEAMKTAVSGDGDTLQDFRVEAQKVYRKDERYSASLPLVPAGGIPKKLARDVRALISPRRGRVRKVKIEWGTIKSGHIFDVDRDDKRIILNSAFRADILAARPASKSDVPAFKLLLFLLLEKDLDQGKVSALQKKRLDLINSILIEAVGLAKG